MSTAAKSAASRKGSGARAAKAAQTNGKPQTSFTFRGVEMPIPEIPDSIAFDLADIQIRGEEEDGQGALIAVHRLLESIFGRDELRKVRPTIKGVEDAWQNELLSQALDAAKELDAGEA